MALQPFLDPLWHRAGLVVPGGLALNLIPHCRPGVPLRWLLTVALIVLTILIVAFALAVGTSYLDAWYLEAGRRPRRRRGSAIHAARLPILATGSGRVAQRD